MILKLMPNWFLSHAFGSKKCTVAFVASKAIDKVKTLPHMKLVATTMRTSKPNWSIQSRHIPPPKSNMCMDCTLMTGQNKLGWAGGIPHYSVVHASVFHTSLVTCSQVMNEVA